MPMPTSDKSAWGPHDSAQRPSVDTISGLIKAILPSRVALQYHLGPTHGLSWMNGAEVLGRGDAL